MDASDQILEECLRYFALAGRPSLPEEFVRYVVNHQHSWVPTMRLDIGPLEREENHYAVLNDDDAEIDPSDRKCVAVAKVSGHPVYEATDTKWLDWGEVLSRHRVSVDYVDEEYLRASYLNKFGHQAP